MHSDPEYSMGPFILFHLTFSFLFGVIMVNVLIAIVSNSYNKIQADDAAISTQLKIGLIRDGMEIKENVNMMKKWLSIDNPYTDGWYLYLITQKQASHEHSDACTPKKILRNSEKLLQNGQKTEIQIRYFFSPTPIAASKPQSNHWSVQIQPSKPIY
jgi:hypothetical protein